MGIHMIMAAQVLALSTVVPTRPVLDVRAATQFERLSLRDFDSAVHEYIELRQLREPMPIDVMTADPEAIERWRARFAARVREARSTAREGEIFNPGIAAIIRYRLERAVRLYRDDALLMRRGEDEGRPPTLDVTVNDDLPWGTALRLPPHLGAELPPLSHGLEYWLIGRDLVLCDARTDLVVDILRDALPLP
jgi:hypothetical protein